MRNKNSYEVIIIGGSYSGLSAAMSLGRALREVLIIDSGTPCNKQTPYSHNFLTRDGQSPGKISELARKQVSEYETVTFYKGRAVKGNKTENGFEINTGAGDTFTAKKLIFATGLKDIMPEIKGFGECWGISILHCPYCHGYEVRNKKTAILANGDVGYHLAQLISNWTKDLVLLTNGKSTLTEEQTEKVLKHSIQIVEQKIDRIEHQNGYVKRLVFNDHPDISVDAIYAKPKFVQQCDIPEKLGCERTKQGLIKVDGFQKTSVDGIFACGDNSGMRAVSVAVSSGTMAGASLNNELINEEF